MNSSITLAINRLTVLVVLFAVQLAPDVSGGWYDNNWTYRQKIIVDSVKVLADLTDYPIYVNLDNFTSVFWSNVKSDGSDIVITAADGTTKLKRELRHFSVGSTVGELHFKSPNLDGDTNSIFYIYYSYASASEVSDTNTWNPNYITVWHMLDSSDGTRYIESARWNYFGTEKGPGEPVENAVGKIYEAPDFDGSNDYIVSSDINEIDGLTAITVEGWGKWEGTLNNMGGAREVIRKDLVFAFGGGCDAAPQNLAKFWIYSAGWLNSGDGTTDIADGNFHYLAGTYDQTSDQLRIYVDGARENQSNQVNKTLSSNTSLAYLGAHTAAAEFWNGLLDEIRVSSVARDSSWIATCYNNLNSPSTFYAIGNQETQGAAHNARRERLIRIGG